MSALCQKYFTYHSKVQQIVSNFILDSPEDADHGFTWTTPLLVHIDH